MKKDEYENNVETNLNNQNFNSRIQVDPTKDTEQKVITFVDKVVGLEHMDKKNW